MIKVVNVQKKYKSNKGYVTNAIKDVSLELPNTGMVFITGKSGSGKSTLINLISGLDTKYEGNIYYNDLNITKFNKSQIEAFRNSQIGYVFQDYCLFQDRTVKENLELVLELKGDSDYSKIDSILEKVDMLEHLNKYPAELSGGEQQRISIARSLVKESSVIIADEPTGALDVYNSGVVLELLKEISKSKLVIVVTHELEYANQYGDRIIELSDGKMVSDKVIQIIQDKELKELEIKKSKLSFLNSFKFAIGNFKNRKIKLAVSIFLIVFAFTLFGITSVIGGYDKNKVYLETLYDNNVEYITVSKQDNSKRNSILSNIMNDNEKKEITENTNKDIIALRTLNDYSIQKLDLRLPRGNIDDLTDEIYPYFLSGYIELSKSTANYFNFDLIHGTYPTSDDEIVITEYMYRAFLKAGYLNYDSDKVDKIKNFNDLKGKVFKDKREFKIVGVIDTNFNYKRYEKLSYSLNEPAFKLLEAELEELSKRSTHTAMYLNDGYFNRNSVDTYLDTRSQVNVDGLEPIKLENRVIKFEDVKDSNEFEWINDKKEALDKYEIILPRSMYDSVYNEMYDDYSAEYEQELDRLICEYVDENYKRFFYEDLSWRDYYYEYILYYDENEYDPTMTKGYFMNLAKEFIEEKYNILNRLNSAKLDVNFTSWEGYPLKYEIEIVGFHNGEGILVSDKIYEDIRNYNRVDGYSGIIVPLTKDIQKDLKFLKNLEKLNLEPCNEYAVMINKVDSIYEVATIIVLIIATGILIFSILLLMNYIDGCIYDRRKDIGILKSIGTSLKDVCKIYFIQISIIALINSILSIILTWVFVSIINSFLTQYFFVILSFPNITIMTFVMFIILSFISSFISLIRPLYKYNIKMDPLDIIRKDI